MTVNTNLMLKSGIMINAGVSEKKTTTIRQLVSKLIQLYDIPTQQLSS